MAYCEHDYKYGPSTTAKAQLLKNITDAGEKGLWIKDDEMDSANELVLEDKIAMCWACERSATLV
tara:strand:+ start:7345 stop:7539 length:195 start_codon:yes stop_codon:yes gene_type:complete